MRRRLGEMRGRKYLRAGESKQVKIHGTAPGFPKAVSFESRGHGWLIQRDVVTLPACSGSSFQDHQATDVVSEILKSDVNLPPLDADRSTEASKFVYPIAKR